MIITKPDFLILKRILALFKPYTKKIIAILICIIFASGINMLLPLIGKQIMDDGLLAKNFGVVVWLSLISFSLILLEQTVGIFETKCRAYINSVMPYTLSKTAFKHLLKLRMQFFNNTNFAEIMNNISMDVNNVARISDRTSFYLITEVFKVVGGVIGLLLINWRLTILVVGIVPLRYWLVKYLAGKRRKTFEKYMEYNRDYSAWYGDTISGIKEIKLWGIERIKIGQFVKNQRGIIKTNITLNFVDWFNEFSETILFQIISNMLYILGAYLVFKNGLTVGGLFAFITYSIYVTAPISAILNLGYNFSNILPSAKRLFDFLDLECETAKAPDGRKPVRIDKNRAQGNIRFEDVSFSYKNGEPVLKKINLEIKPGEKVAVIGANGSGKTTIINLLLRFYTPDHGRILLDGTDINELNLRDYRRLISVVSQDLYLFNATINDNIANFSPMPEFQVFQAAKKSRAHDFISAMPQQYTSKIGNNGAGLSGGEKQKIAMARAFARDSKILALDEATSNYDLESETQVNELLKNGFEDRTVLIITHRPDVLKQVDRIIILEKGRITDLGTHEELSRKNSFYQEMLSRGNKKEKEKYYVAG